MIDEVFTTRVVVAELQGCGTIIVAACDSHSQIRWFVAEGSSR